MNKNKITNIQIQFNSNRKVTQYNLKGTWPFKFQANYLISSLTNGNDYLCIVQDCMKDISS